MRPREGTSQPLRDAQLRMRLGASVPCDLTTRSSRTTPHKSERYRSERGQRIGDARLEGATGKVGYS